MPLTRLIADTFGVVTVCLVILLVLLGLVCICYSVYFRCRIRQRGYRELSYFSNPWLIRILFILFTVWWGFGEIIRLSLFRYQGRVVHAFNTKWQSAVCNMYLVSNLGFAEPCMLITIVYLLRASLKQKEFMAPHQNWSARTAVYIFLSCLPIFILQLTSVLAAPKMNRKEKLPAYFTRSTLSRTYDDAVIDLCMYPLASTILHGLSVGVLVAYIIWLGTQTWYSIINKWLQRRVFILIAAVSIFFPLRVLLLGLSVLSQPERLVFETLVFIASIVLLCCGGVGIWILVFCPIYDSLSLKGLRDMEIGRISIENHHDEISTSAGRHSDDSTKRGSISFRTMLKDGAPTEVYEELSLFSPPQSAHNVASPLSKTPPPELSES